MEGPVLRDYYNVETKLPLYTKVVEGPVLRGYYNYSATWMSNATSCGRSSFEGLLQLVTIHCKFSMCCGRSSFEGLLQL